MKVKSIYFKKELSAIRDTRVRNMTEYLLDNRVPDYFIELPSSSSGRYHPKNKEGNQESLIEHTKSVVRVLCSFLTHPDISSKFSDYDKDILISSAILHDCVKYDYPDQKDHTVFSHPVLVKALIDDEISRMYLHEFVTVCDVISTHHGPWTVNRYEDLVLPTMKDNRQWYLHLADYIASRDFIRVDYDNDQSPFMNLR